MSPYLLPEGKRFQEFYVGNPGRKINNGLTLSMLSKNSGDDILKYFSYFFPENGT